jgi:hypothetical protein
METPAAAALSWMTGNCGWRGGTAIFHLPFSSLVRLSSAAMFDIVRPQISTAADKLTHLRRFL